MKSYDTTSLKFCTGWEISRYANLCCFDSAINSADPKLTKDSLKEYFYRQVTKSRINKSVPTYTSSLERAFKISNRTLLINRKPI